MKFILLIKWGNNQHSSLSPNMHPGDTITIRWPIVINGTQMPDFMMKLDFQPVRPWWKFWAKNEMQSLPKGTVDLVEIKP